MLMPSLFPFCKVPRIEKVVVNCGVGEASQNAKVLENAIKDISTVTGQRPCITRARKAIAGFKIRAGVPVGLAVTLRGEVCCFLCFWFYGKWKILAVFPGTDSLVRFYYEACDFVPLILFSLSRSVS
jgi:hypothetical protein